MKKCGKILTVILWIFNISMLFLFFILTRIKDNVSREIMLACRNVVAIGIIIILGMVILYVCVGIMGVIKKGVHNIRECDDDLFKEIDEYKKCWGESDDYYERQIQIINLYYADKGKVDELIANRKLTRLFRRMDFLSVQCGFYDTAMTYLYSIILSVIASLVCKVLECDDVVYILVWGAIILISFLVILLLKYSERGEDGSFRYFIDEYEKKLLGKKIENMEAGLLVAESDRDVIEMQKVVINELIKIRKKAKRAKVKEGIEHDIKRVESLKLCLGDYSSCYKKKIYIKQNEGCLVYDKKRGEKCNYTDKGSLKTREYIDLYEILERYGLVNDFQQSKKEKGKDMKEILRRFFLFERIKICFYLVVFSFLFQYIYILIFTYINGTRMEVRQWNFAIMFMCPLLLSLVCALVDYRMKKDMVSGICFKVIEAYQEREQYKRFLAVKKCIKSFKNSEDDECDIKRNIEVIEAAIAHDQAYSIMFSVFATVVSAIVFDALKDVLGIVVVFWIAELMLILACYLLILIPQNSFIQKVVENIKSEL